MSSGRKIHHQTNIKHNHYTSLWHLTYPISDRQCWNFKNNVYTPVTLFSSNAERVVLYIDIKQEGP